MLCRDRFLLNQYPKLITKGKGKVWLLQMSTGARVRTQCWYQETPTVSYCFRAWSSNGVQVTSMHNLMPVGRALVSHVNLMFRRRRLNECLGDICDARPFIAEINYATGYRTWYKCYTPDCQRGFQIHITLIKFPSWSCVLGNCLPPSRGHPIVNISCQWVGRKL